MCLLRTQLADECRKDNLEAGTARVLHLTSWPFFNLILLPTRQGKSPLRKVLRSSPAPCRHQGERHAHGGRRPSQGRFGGRQRLRRRSHSRGRRHPHGGRHWLHAEAVGMNLLTSLNVVSPRRVRSTYKVKNWPVVLCSVWQASSLNRGHWLNFLGARA